MTFINKNVLRLTAMVGLQLAALHADAQNTPGDQVWLRRFNRLTAAKDTAAAVAADSAGNVIVAGTVKKTSSSTTMALIKYSGAGQPLWTNFYNGQFVGKDNAVSVTTDENDNVIFIGSSAPAGSTSASYQYDYVTLAYSSGGMPLWTNIYGAISNASDSAKAVVARSNRVYVTGYTRPNIPKSSATDISTIAYTTTGVPVWTNLFTGAGTRIDTPYAIALAPNGDVLVTGQTESNSGSLPPYSLNTLSYSAAGVPLWTNLSRVSLGDGGRAIAVDSAGTVYVTGWSSLVSSGNDFRTVAYSSSGTILWENLYSGPGKQSDSPKAILIGPGGNIYVTGSSPGTNTGTDFATLAYSNTGVPLWTNRFTEPGTNSDISIGLVTDGTNIYVGGCSTGQLGSDFVVVAYSESGLPLWTNLYSVPGSTLNIAVGMAYANNQIFLTGTSTMSGTNDDFVTLAYSTAGDLLWTRSFGVLQDVSNEPFGLVADKHDNVYVAGNAGGMATTTIAYAPNGAPLWTNDCNAFSLAGALGLAMDDNGSIFIGGNNYAVFALSSQGSLLWTNSASPFSMDEAEDMFVDKNNHLFLTGGQSPAYRTTAFSTSGSQLWAQQVGLYYPGAIVADAVGNTYVAGENYNNGFRGALVSYSPASLIRWTTSYPLGGDSFSKGLVLAPNGNLYVLGFTRSAAGDEDIATLAYTTNGTPLWTKYYSYEANSDDYPIALAADADSNIYITGLSYRDGTNCDFVTIAYTGAGIPLWTNRYDGGGYDLPAAIGVDGQCVYVTGSAYGPNGSDLVTIAYSKAGVPLWTNRYDGPAHGNDQPLSKKCLAVVSDGVVVSANSRATSGVDEYVTIKYFAHPGSFTSSYGAAVLKDQPLLIGVSNLLAAVSPTLSTVSFVSVSTPSAQGGSLLYSGNTVTYSPPPAYVGADQFSYIVTDNANTTNAVTGNIAVLPAGSVINGFSGLTVVIGQTNGFSFNFTGLPNQSWSVYWSSEVTGPWQKIRTLTLPPEGLVPFFDFSRNTPNGFYRATQP